MWVAILALASLVRRSVSAPGICFLYHFNKNLWLKSTPVIKKILRFYVEFRVILLFVRSPTVEIAA